MSRPKLPVENLSIVSNLQLPLTLAKLRGNNVDMKRFALALGLVSFGAIAWSMFQGAKLVLDGQTISTRGIVQGGQLYVPASDVAKALGKSYAYNAGTKTGSIADGGGTNQNDGVSGNAGDWLTNGRTRIKLEPGFTEKDNKKLISFEVRNGEKKLKNYKFGYVATDYILYDEEGNSKEGELEDRDAYSVDLQPAAMKRFKVYYKFDESFKPVRLVVILGTQISGNPAKDEVFRIKL